MIKYNDMNLNKKGSDKMIQLDQIKIDLPVAKANLVEVGGSL